MQGSKRISSLLHFRRGRRCSARFSDSLSLIMSRLFSAFAFIELSLHGNDLLFFSPAPSQSCRCWRDRAGAQPSLFPDLERIRILSGRKRHCFDSWLGGGGARLFHCNMEPRGDPMERRRGGIPCNESESSPTHRLSAMVSFNLRSLPLGGHQSPRQFLLLSIVFNNDTMNATIVQGVS